MASQLGHGSPLGAFHNLGSGVQRRSLGASSLSILNLAAFYPYGFPAIAPERSVSESQPSSSDDSTVARQIDTSAPDSCVSGAERTSIPLSSEQADPFRTSLQRYFKPETSTSLKVETTVSNPAAANVKTDLSQNTDLISENHTLQRSTTEDILQPAPNSSQLSGTNTTAIAESSQNRQPSPSTSRASADSHSEIQRATELTNGQTDRLPIDSSVIEPNTSALTQQPPAASININQSIQSLRTPFASVQRSDEQPIQSVEQPSDFNTPSDTESDTDSKPLVSPNTSSSLDAHLALQPDISGPPIQRLHESTEAPSSLPSPDQNLAAPSALEPDQTLQRQPDSTAAAIPAHPATPQTESIQRITEQNNTASEQLSGSEARFYQPSTRNRSDSVSTGPLTGSIQNSKQPEPASGQLDISPKIQAKSNQIPFSDNSSNSSPAQQPSNLASENVESNQPTISSDQIAPPFSETERSLDTSLSPAQSKPTSESSGEVQRQPDFTAEDSLTDSESLLTVNPSLELSQTKALDSAVDIGQLDITEPLDILSHPKAAVQRSTAELTEIEAEQGITEKPSSQKQTINEQIAIAPPTSTTDQTSSHTAIQQFPNLSDPDTRSIETDRSPSTPAGQSEPITIDSLHTQSDDSAHQEIQCTPDTVRLTASTASTTHSKQLAPVTDIQSPSKVDSLIVQAKTAEAVDSPSIASASIQRAADVTQPAKSASLSEQVNPLADIQRASETPLPLAQSKLTSESLNQIQQQPDITSEDSVSAVTNPAATNVAGSVQRMAESSISETSATALSDTSGQDFDSNQQTTEVAAQATGKAPQSVISVPPVSESIQHATDADQLVKSTPSAISSDRITPAADIQKTLTIISHSTQSELTSENLEQTQQQSDSRSEQSVSIDPSPPVYLSSVDSLNPANFVQRSTADLTELPDQKNIAKQPVYQNRGDQDAIAPPLSTNQTASNIEIQRSPNFSGSDDSPKETNPLPFPPTHQPSAATESIAFDPTNGESVTDSHESIQRATIDSFLENNHPTAQPSTLQKYAIHPSVAGANESSDIPVVNNSADLVQRMTESSTSEQHVANLSTLPQNVAIQPEGPQTAKSQRSTSEPHQSQSTSSTPDTIQRAANRHFRTHKTLGHSSRKPLSALQPLGILKPLPSLKSDQSISPSLVSPQSQSSTIQRQIISNTWSNLESLVDGLASNSQQNVSTSPDTTQKPITEETANSNLSANVDSSNDNSATTQRQSSEIDSSIQRQADSIPSEWSNLEDLVTHLQSNTSNPAAKTAFSDKPSNSQSTVKSAPQPQQTTQPVKLDKPANVTVQRQIANPPSATKPTIIQACQDTSSKANSTNTDEQTDEQTEDSQSYSQYVELLAQEVYSLLRQRLSLEQERRGPKYPR